MNKKEIIEYLKQNKEKGVVFAFMSQDVRDWCMTHRNDPIFNIYFSDGWNIIRSGINCCYSGIYCLPEDYEIEPEFKAHWEEFDIDKNGFFVEEQVNTHVSPRVYHWWQWTRFLSDHDAKYNDFGGWVYEMSLFGGGKTEVLATSPHFLDDDEELSSYIRLNNKDKVKPAYPTKILFWRYAE